MNSQNEIFILDGSDKKALEACLMELSDLFWEVFEQKRLRVVVRDDKCTHAVDSVPRDRLVIPRF